VTQCDQVELSPEAKQSYDNLILALAEAKKRNWYGANVAADPICNLGWSDEVKIRLPGKWREIETRNRDACRRSPRSRGIV
jgi:hypothetical protein